MRTEDTSWRTRRIWRITTRRSSRHRHREPRIQELIDDGSGSEGGSGSARQSHASASLDDFEATEANVQHRVHGALDSHARQRPRGNNAAPGSRREWNVVADGGGAEDSELLALARESRHQLLGVPEELQSAVALRVPAKEANE